MNKAQSETEIREQQFVQEVIADYKLACESREASLLGRKEVLTGKAKFGIFGDGKEVAQLAMAKQFQNGDFRSGYYRDQTFMMAIGALTIRQLFAALYAHTDPYLEPASAGRQMGGHFSTHSLNADGSWKNLMEQKNTSADISPTAAQMPRLLGLAQASSVYKNLKDLPETFKKFSDGGNEVAFGTIGDASTSEGVFFETINAAGVLQVPMVMSVWDDGYGISVPKEYQTTKGSISELLSGLQRTGDKAGYEIFRVKGWDYPALVQTYEKAVVISRKEHVPVLIHVEEMTQPQGHSTSGSHERYKSKKTLAWAEEFDCISKMREWILNRALAETQELDKIESEAKKFARAEQKAAWQAFKDEVDAERDMAVALLSQLAEDQNEVQSMATHLQKLIVPTRKDIFSQVRQAIWATAATDSVARQNLAKWLHTESDKNADRYNSYLYASADAAITNIPNVEAQFNENDERVDGRIILRDNFKKLFEMHPEILTFGEDVGKIGGVNQSMEGMQEAFGKLRVSDTGIREASIVGQGIGMALRGLRPIAEIQYLDYILYALQIMSDDLATLHYRTKGGQKAPLIVRTRGHRLEGIWHSGSPMGTIVNSLRGMIICVPRNMVTAAGMYNTLIKSSDPALVIEPLNGYRSKEKKPQNLGKFTVAMGIPEVVRNGKDLTIVSYGSTCNLVEEAIDQLQKLNVDVEVIDIRTFLPFDIHHSIAKSLAKTNRLLIVDEDVPGGASAFILDKVLTDQKGYKYLDSAPITLSAKAHRPAYGSDGDYFSKPNIEDIVEAAFGMMREADPKKYPGSIS